MDGSPQVPLSMGFPRQEYWSVLPLPTPGHLPDPVAQMVKNLPAVWETWVGSLGQEDPLEKDMATHSSILAWEIPWTEEPGRLQSMGVTKKSDTTEVTRHTSMCLINKHF